MRLFNVMQNNVGDSTFQTVQNTRMDIVAELEAIVQYENHLRQTDKLSAQQTLTEIISEEQVHVGELFGLLFRLDPQSKVQFDRGLAEYNDRAQRN